MKPTSKMIDTHAHLNFADFDRDRTEVMAKLSWCLQRVITVGVDPTTSQVAARLARRSNLIAAAVGIHPEEAPQDLAKIGSRVGKLSELVRAYTNAIVAIGEIGLDYHSAYPNPKIQVALFEAQLKLAWQIDLPIIIHSRDAFDDTLKLLSALKSKSRRTLPKGVWHSFTGNFQQAEKILSLGFLVGINGIVTYSSARELQKATRQIPLNRIVLETDAPFLTPQKYRQQGISRCEPWMVREVAATIAALKGVSLDEVIQATSFNARKLFEFSRE